LANLFQIPVFSNLLFSELTNNKFLNLSYIFSN